MTEIDRCDRIEICDSGFRIDGDKENYNEKEWQTADGLLTYSMGGLHVLAGSDGGSAGVRFCYSDDEIPESGQWDSSATVHVNFVDGLSFVDTYSEKFGVGDDLKFLSLPERDLIVRVSVTGRSRALNSREGAFDAEDPSELPEQFLVEAWPAGADMNYGIVVESDG
ncbi:hypothetical protein [Gordonia liuliyuniae]|uniref:Uncharacterized protein n=1 Tax=Gordonia liuliyuniae TaxID=2911517 RepID=A0ABS9IQH6_9ACTN|nr:hypothetical protein [Gordonia liuliyuniae]MCF8587794.1 hypothetical protein [Gordonia liuliyuniae]